MTDDWREDLRQVTRNQIARAEDRESELPREQLDAAVDYWEQHSAKWEKRAKTERKQKRDRELFIKRILTFAAENPDAPASEVGAMIREDMRTSREGKS